jgi:transcriptional regulator with XRE-family HTH domain
MMTRGAFKEIVEKISIEKGLNYSAIAEKAGIGRSNFSTILNNEPSKPLQRKTLERVKNLYPEYFEQTEQPGSEIQNSKMKKQPPPYQGVALDVSASLLKLEVVSDVMLSVLAEILANQQGRTAMAVREELEEVTRKREHALAQLRPSA